MFLERSLAMEDRALGLSCLCFLTRGVGMALEQAHGIGVLGGLAGWMPSIYSVLGKQRSPPYWGASLLARW